MAEPASVPLAVALSLCAALTGAGVSWGITQGQVSHNKDRIAEIAGEVAAHHALPSHAVTIANMQAISVRLEALERDRETARQTREAVLVIERNVRALCAASHAAGCAQ